MRVVITKNLIITQSDVFKANKLLIAAKNVDAVRKQFKTWIIKTEKDIYDITLYFIQHSTSIYKLRDVCVTYIMRLLDVINSGNEKLKEICESILNGCTELYDFISGVRYATEVK